MFIIMGFHNPAVSQCPVDGGSLVLPATVLQRKIVTAALAVGADIRPYSNPEIGTGYDIGSKVIPFHLAQSLMSFSLMVSRSFLEISSAVVNPRSAVIFVMTSMERFWQYLSESTLPFRSIRFTSP